MTAKADIPALAAAEIISAGLELNEPLGPLTPGMRDAILDVLGPGTHNGLLELRAALANDRRARS